MDGLVLPPKALPECNLRDSTNALGIRHGLCFSRRWRANAGPGGSSAHRLFCGPLNLLEDSPMAWTTPELEVVSVTMEVTAYAATL
jgi:coenzyme PQQ precursor peptide PqqA